jgi:hypothetical protein
MNLTIVGRRPLLYRRGADPSLDRPAHVRAASALAWVGEQLIVVQDDSAFLAVVDPETGLCDDLPLPPCPAGRRVFDQAIGNKKDKPDLESVFADGETMIALGSGGPIAARQVIVTWRPGSEPRIVAAPRFFDAIAAVCCPAGTSLNLEGAVARGGTLLLANRGGDRAGDAVSPDAIVTLELELLRALIEDPERAPLPALHVTTVQLGDLAGAPLHFTDLGPGPGGGPWFAAAAEATSSYFDDGDVVGSVIGRLDDLRTFALEGRDKVEGIAVDRRAPDRFLAVTDPDDPERPGELLEIVVS